MTDYVNFHTLATLLTALALGGSVYFSFLVAPVTFRKLGKEAAAPLISAYFRLYYPYLAGTTAIAGGLLFYRSEALVLWAIAAASLFGLLVIRPAVENLRAGRQAGEPAATRGFRQLHGLSMALNLLQIIALIWIFSSLVRQ
jgi:hypothetical protein